MEIPLNICTFYHDKSNIPENMKKNFDKLASENCEFNVELFDVNSSRKFIETNFDKNVLDAYDSLKPYAYKSDLFRLCYLYSAGGIYVDVKYEPVNGFKFKELISSQYLVSEPLGVQNCLIVMNKHNEFILKCINIITHNALNKYCGFSPLFTGPFLLSNEFSTDFPFKECTINNRHHIFKNNSAILIQYESYRVDLQNSSDQPHYNVMYWNRNIYN